jgi:very-short-patch-repair endonuclease
MSFEDCREIVRSLNLKSQKDWVKWCKNNKCTGIPTNPNVVFKNNGWLSMADWLGIDSYHNMRNIKYVGYDECKIFLRENHPLIKKKEDWLNLNKKLLPIYIPKRPDYLYRKTNEWISWDSFLSSPPSHITRSKKFISFNEAKTFLKNLNLIDVYEYKSYIISNNIDFLPKRPDYFYRNEWRGYLYFLNSEGNRTSIGEKLIKKFLIDNKIEFEKEKRFDTCVNIKQLPFDFYLPYYKTCIEYDGELHYKNVSIFGGIKRLEQVKMNDDIKTKWCISNGVKLIRIHYLDKSKISTILKSILGN